MYYNVLYLLFHSYCVCCEVATFFIVVVVIDLVLKASTDVLRSKELPFKRHVDQIVQTLNYEEEETVNSVESHDIESCDIESHDTVNTRPSELHKAAR